MKKKYRLLKNDDIIKNGDEFLDEDCNSWRRVNDECGVRIYSSDSLRPFRREIKKQMTFSDWLIDYCGQQNTDFKYSAADMEACHEWTVANERLKHEPKQTLEDFEKTIPEKKDPECHRCWIQGIRFGWQADEKNRGYDE